MKGDIRRVVTGHDDNGRAIVISDGPAPTVHTNSLRPGYLSTDLWRTHTMPARVAQRAEDPTPGPRRQLPTANGTVIRINEVPPDSDGLLADDPESVRKVFAELGNESGSTFVPGARHPMMHRTETIDYAIVLSGELTMVLDDEDVLLRAGDVVVQCGTNHAWSNRSNAPARIAFILIDGTFEDAEQP